MKKIKIESLEQLDKAVEIARTYFMKKPPIDVVVKQHSESLTDSQRGLYWQWVRVIAADLGNTDIEQHEYFKERFFVNIYIADPDNHPAFIGVAENMKIVREQCPEQYPSIRQLVMKAVSHLDATKENMQQALREVENFAHGYQVRLPAPPREGLK